MKIKAEYIWIDGTNPVRKLRSKTKIVDIDDSVFPGFLDDVDDSRLKVSLNDFLPDWGFDGSSTNQADGNNSDCVLKPVKAIRDTIRNDDSLLVLCEVYTLDDELNEVEHSSNTRALARAANQDHGAEKPLFGIEQEYVFLKDGRPLGWPEKGFPPPQGPFYCGVGADEVFGREIAEEHLNACLAAGLPISGINAEVMPGQWEFQVGPASILEVSDGLWLARYLLYRAAEKYDVSVTLDPKPVRGDWNGSGAHTNFSTQKMREDGGIDACLTACSKLKSDFDKVGFPDEYGVGFKTRLTGAHETCSFKEFKYGVGDRTASIRIPLHVNLNGKGYIEDRRPCSNIDPYQVVTKLTRVVCG